MQLALEQLRGAAQAAERILDLVRELPNHQAAAHRGAPAARSRARCAGAAWRRRARAAGTLPVELASSGVMVTSMTRCSRPSGPVSTVISRSDSVSPVSSARRMSAIERIGFEHQREEGFAARLVEAEGEQILRGDVGVDQAQVANRAPRCPWPARRSDRRDRSARSRTEGSVQPPCRPPGVRGGVSVAARAGGFGVASAAAPGAWANSGSADARGTYEVGAAQRRAVAILHHDRHRVRAARSTGVSVKLAWSRHRPRVAAIERASSTTSPAAAADSAAPSTARIRDS